MDQPELNDETIEKVLDLAEDFGEGTENLSEKVDNKKFIKCEVEECDSLAKLRIVKDVEVRVFLGLDNFDKSTKTITKEMFICPFHYNGKEDWEIKEWIVEKLPYNLLFHYDRPHWMDYADEHGLKYWDISREHDLRWDEQKFCTNCGNKLKHEIRKYENNDGYDSPSRWVETYKIVLCENCGYFGYLRHHREDYFTSSDVKGEYSNWSSPQYEPEYKEWQKILKEMKENGSK